MVSLRGSMKNTFHVMADDTWKMEARADMFRGRESLRRSRTERSMHEARTSRDEKLSLTFRFEFPRVSFDENVINYNLLSV